MQFISITYYCNIIETKTIKKGNLSKTCLLYNCSQSAGGALKSSCSGNFHDIPRKILWWNLLQKSCGLKKGLYQKSVPENSAIFFQNNCSV